jgi:hypothetical protein
MNRRRLLTLAVLLLVLCAGWSVRFLFFQPPAEQLGRVQAKFLHAVEKRDWKTIRFMMADEYLDDFGHEDPEAALQTAQDILSSYFSLTLKTQTTYLKGTNHVGMVKQKIKIEGTGSPVSQIVTTRVNATTEPWVFHWLKKGRWPWDWKLVQLQNEYIQ